MKGKIKKLVEEACPLHVVIGGKLHISTDSVHSLLTALFYEELHVSVSIKSTASYIYSCGREYRLCHVNFEYDKE